MHGARMAPARRVRADYLVVEQGLSSSRSQAQALIMAGKVFKGQSRVEKPGQMLAPGTLLRIHGERERWVSRAGYKLDHALDFFGIDVTGATAVDLGASTGGFVDVLLSRGAARIYAVDVGAGQLAWALQQDERVIALDRTNARSVSRDEIPIPPTVVVADVSFISLKLALPPTLGLAAPGARLVALIKPQFEAGRSSVGKGGIVRDAMVHEAVCDNIRTWLLDEAGWTVDGITASPITGAKGNREFLIAAHKPLNSLIA